MKRTPATSAACCCLWRFFAAGLAVALALAGNSGAALTSRVVVVAFTALAFCAQAFTAPRDLTDLNPVLLVVAPVSATVLAIVARVTEPGRAPGVITLAGVVIAAAAISVWLVYRYRRSLNVERAAILGGLSASGRRVSHDEVKTVRSHDLRPGEEIVLSEGETSPADAIVIAGEAEVTPWLGARHSERREEGESIVAGARLVSGRLRAVVSWAEYDRSWLRLTHDPRRRVDVHFSTGSVGTSHCGAWGPHLGLPCGGYGLRRERERHRRVCCGYCWLCCGDPRRRCPRSSAPRHEFGFARPEARRRVSHG